jgi:hypothetical protein
VTDLILSSIAERCVAKDGRIGASWFETPQRVRAKRGPMINSDALLTMRRR